MTIDTERRHALVDDVEPPLVERLLENPPHGALVDLDLLWNDLI